MDEPLIMTCLPVRSKLFSFTVKSKKPAFLMFDVLNGKNQDV